MVMRWRCGLANYFGEPAGAPRDSMRIESLSRFPSAIVVNRLLAAFRTTALMSGAWGERLITLRLSAPNSHDFL
jgi:hypothetical protein